MFSEAYIIDALHKCGITRIQSYDKYLIIHCPFAKENHEKQTDRHPSFSIRKDNWTYFCYSCKTTGSFFNLIYKLAIRQNSEELENLASTFLADDFFEFTDDKKVEKKEIKIYSEDSLSQFPRATSCTQSLEYLQKRQISEKIADKYDLRVDIEHSRVCFPVRNQKGHLVGLQGRSFAENYRQRYYNYWMFDKGQTVGGINQVDSEYVLVLEGFFGLLKTASLTEFCPREISPLTVFGSMVSYTQAADIMALDKKIVICLDNDIAGKKGAKILKERLKYNAYSVTSITLPKDIDEITQDEFLTLFNTTTRNISDVTF